MLNPLGEEPNENARNPKVSGVSFMTISQSNRILNLQRCLPIDFRLASDLNRSALPSTNFQLPSDIASTGCAVDQLPTFIGDQSSAVPSESTSNFHRILHSPVLLSNQPPTFAGYCILRPGLRTNFQFFIGYCIFQLHLRINLRLSSDIAPSSSAFRPTSDSHRISRL